MSREGDDFMSKPNRDPRQHRVSPLSAGLQWASSITTVGLEMALPPLFGAWVDRQYGTSPLWTVVLAVLGFAVAMRHLWDISKRLNRQADREAGARRDTK